MTDGSLRLFTAIELPDDWRTSLARLQSELEAVAGGQLRMVRPDLMHLSLVFLGNQPPARLPEIEAALSSAATSAEAFSITMGRPGAFGPPHAISVVWTGLASTPAPFQQLHRAISSELDRAGIEFDRKPLVPHLTLGRARRTMERTVSTAIHAALQTLGPRQAPPAEVREFVLMRSRLSPAGPNYETLGRFPVGAKHG